MTQTTCGHKTHLSDGKFVLCRISPFHVHNRTRDIDSVDCPNCIARFQASGGFPKQIIRHGKTMWASRLLAQKCARIGHRCGGSARESWGDMEEACACACHDDEQPVNATLATDEELAAEWDALTEEDKLSIAGGLVAVQDALRRPA